MRLLLPTELPREALSWAWLLDSQPCAALWTWLKALDPKGSGFVVFRLADAARTLRRTQQTIRDQLKKGQRSGWFRSVDRLERGVFRVYLAGHLKVAARLGLDELGPAAWVPVERLCDPRRLAVDIAAEEYQECSRRARIKELRDGDLQDPADRAKRGPKGKGKVKDPSVPKAHDLLTDQPCYPTSASSTGGNGGDRSARQQPVLQKGDRNLYLDSWVEITGVSQAYLAKALERSLSTIRRRQSNRLRQRLDRPTVIKRQACQLVKHDRLSPAQHFAQIRATARSANDPIMAIDSARYFMQGGRLWYACTNLYLVHDIHACSQRRKRARYKKLNLGGGPSIWV